MVDKPDANAHPGKIRLHKHMAACGAASRRKCEEMIAAGRVTVNGTVVSRPGSLVDPLRDTVRIDGKEVSAPDAGLVYFAFHKPRGYLVSASDPWGRKTIYDLLGDISVRVVPVGRLDLDSEGLLLLTNDGDLAHRLMHPRYGIEKEYEVSVAHRVETRALERLRAGVAIEGIATQPARVRVVRSSGEECVLRISIREGRKRQVRLMMRTVGHSVQRLKRVREGDIHLGDLAPGAVRPLTAAEVRLLKGSLTDK